MTNEAAVILREIAETLPDNQEIAQKLPSPVLYRLEAAGQIATKILDERVVEWTRDGWTQQAIANEIGCDRSRVSRRQARLGLQPAHPEKARDLRAGRTQIDRGPAPTSQYLPDITAPDADTNLRTQVAQWFELGRHIEQLLISGRLETKSPQDKESIQSDARLMCDIARKVGKAVK